MSVWTRRRFLATTASAGAALAVAARAPAFGLPAGASEISAADRARFAGPVRPSPLSQVRLLPGAFLDARALNTRYLLSLPQDRLLHTFRVNAGIPSSARAGRRVGEAGLRAARPLHGALPLGVRAVLRGDGRAHLQSRRPTRWSRSWRDARRRSAAAISRPSPRSSSIGCAAASRSGRPSTRTTRFSRGSSGQRPLRQRAGAADRRGHGRVGAQLDQGSLRRTPGAHPHDRVRRHGRVALRALRGHGQGGLPRARALVRPAGVPRSARRAARRADRPARQHADSQGHRRGAALRADRRAALPRHRRVLLAAR